MARPVSPYELLLPADGQRVCPPTPPISVLDVWQLLFCYQHKTPIRQHVPDLMIGIGRWCLYRVSMRDDVFWHPEQLFPAQVCAAHADITLFIFNPGEAWMSHREVTHWEVERSSGVVYGRCVQFKWKTRGFKQTCSYTQSSSPTTGPGFWNSAILDAHISQWSWWSWFYVTVSWVSFKTLF